MAGNLATCLASMGKLERTLAELDALPRKLAEAVSPILSREIDRQFDRGVDPYGRRWKKLATGKRSYLTESGRLRRGTRASPLPGKRAGVRILLGAKYAIYHQTGTRYMPARKILPERGMPASWRTAINREAARLARRVK